MSPSSQTPESQPNTKPFASRSRRRKRWFLLIIAAVLALLAASHLLSWMISRKLKSEIDQQLNARLELGSVTYVWPYSVRIDHARLIAADSTAGPFSLLNVGRIELTLAKMPWKTGPLVFQKIMIQDPIVHLIRTTAGLAGGNLVKTPPSLQPQANQKLSDLFELRRLTIAGGQVEYQDRRQSPPLPTVVWNNLNADLHTTPAGGSNYQFQFTARNASLAVMDATADIDIDTLLLNVSRLSIVVQTEKERPSTQLPPNIQAICRQFAIGGKVSITATARIPLMDPNRSLYDTKINLRDGSCKLPQWSAPISPINLDLACSKGSSPDTHLSLSSFKIASGNQNLQVNGGDGTINSTDGTWSFGHIAGLADLGDAPGPIGQSNLLMHLPFSSTGAGDLRSGACVLNLAVNNGSALFTPKKLPLNQIIAKTKITPNHIQLDELTATTCSGQVELQGDGNWNNAATGFEYAGNLSLAHLDIRQVADFLISDKQTREMASGIGDLHAQFSGTIPPHASIADAFTSKGDLDIRHGHFLNIPVLKNVLADVKEANAATVGEAAAKFNIANNRIHFEQAAASAPAVGVLGHGDLDFDGSLNMSFIVTPLADWRAKLASTDVPILNTVGALIAAKAQSAVNTAENVVLYQYRVTGSLTDPKTEQIPAPILTDAMKPLFQKMSNQHQDDAMSKELRQQQSTTQ